MYTKQQLDQAILDARAAAQQADISLLSGNLGFELPGANTAEQITNLTNVIGVLQARSTSSSSY